MLLLLIFKAIELQLLNINSYGSRMYLGTPGATGIGSNASLWQGCHSVLALS